MSRESLHQPRQPLQVTLTGSAEGLFKQIYSASRREGEKLETLKFLGKPKEYTEGYWEERKVVIYSADISLDRKTLFTHRLFWIDSDIPASGTGVLYEPRIDLKINRSIAPQPLLRDRDSADRIVAALVQQGYDAEAQPSIDWDKSDRLAALTGLGEGETIFKEDQYEIHIVLPGSGAHHADEAVITVGDMDQIFISVQTEAVHFKGDFDDETEYAERIQELREALATLIRIAEALSLAIAKTITSELPTPEKIEIVLPDN